SSAFCFDIASARSARPSSHTRGGQDEVDNGAGAGVRDWRERGAGGRQRQGTLSARGVAHARARAYGLATAAKDPDRWWHTAVRRRATNARARGEVRSRRELATSSLVGCRRRRDRWLVRCRSDRGG